MKDPIERFIGKYRFLSNFWKCLITYEGITYPSVEHAFQAQKTLDRNLQTQISKIIKPGMVKRFGRKISLREDWENIKLQIMENLVRIKFTENIDLKQKLLSTGNTRLIEGNTWGDQFWGVYKGVGENYLGKILMKIRNELKGDEVWDKDFKELKVENKNIRLCDDID